MKAMIALLFLVAVAVYARAEMEYHPQAILHYLEMEEREMARKIHSYLELRTRPTRFPSPRPTMVPPTNDAARGCIGMAVVCHRRAGENACAHLQCVKQTSVCLHRAGVRPTPDMIKCLPVIPLCMLTSNTCEERLCCLVRFGECLKRLGYEQDVA